MNQLDNDDDKAAVIHAPPVYRLYGDVFHMPLSAELR
jgi:hypothetical protein